MERTPWMLPSGSYTKEVISWNLHQGSYLVELTPWKLLGGTYTWKLPSLIYTMEVTS